MVYFLDIMKLKTPHLRSIFHAMLITLTVALLVVEAQLVFGGGFLRVFAQNPGGGAPAAGEPAPAPAGAEADPGAPAPTTADEATLAEQQQCLTFMRPTMESKRKEFAEFINEHFKSKDPTSDLIPVAVERLRQYRDEVRAEIKKFGPVANRNATVVAAENGACIAAANKEFKMVKELLQNHIQENSYAKKSTRLLDKYKEINSQLDAMNFDVAQMFANFSIFSQKLPCYTRECQ